MDERLASTLSLLADYTSQHVLLSAVALALGVATSLPLAVLASRRPRLRWAVLAIASLVQTIPGLALLALFYPLLLGLSALTGALFGFGVPALGFLPSVLALTIYSMLPILRNGVTAMLGVDPACLEAADGVGMTSRQKLFRVELPLAAPVIMAGIRTAAVWTIGMATLSTTVGQTSLGNFIFSGLQTENWISVLTGCAAVVVLALITDHALGLIEAAAVRRDGWRMAIGLAVLLQFNRFAVMTGIASLVIVAVYPFMKRITWWPQIVLGLAFSWGALMGFAVTFARIDATALALYAGSIAWVIGYDTIYAHQDAEDDALIGIKSTALLFGARTHRALVAFYTLAVLLIGAALVGESLEFETPKGYLYFAMAFSVAVELVNIRLRRLLSGRAH